MSLPAPRRGDEAALYRRHHPHLLRSVRRAVSASDALVEDACSFAWVQFLRHQPERRPEMFAWLRTVAIREAYHLSRNERRELHLDAERATDAEPANGADRLEDPRACLERQIDAREALHVVAKLRPRQRRLFALKVAGFSYDETSAITGDSFRTVDRQLRRAQAHVRAGASPAPS